jgi:hypothetical protein
VAKVPTHPCDRHGIPSYTDAAGTVHIATGGRCTGPDRLPAPAGPDPERDARRAAYREKERRRAARALDRYIEIIYPHAAGLASATTDRMVASERFVEQVGDYVLSRLGERVCGNCGMPRGTNAGSCDECTASPMHHKSNYGVSTPGDNECFRRNECVGDPACLTDCGKPHNADHGVPRAPRICSVHDQADCAVCGSVPRMAMQDPALVEDAYDREVDVTNSLINAGHARPYTGGPR